MKPVYSTSIFRKVLVPVVYECDPTTAITAACAIAGKENVLLTGFVHVNPEDSLSVATQPARKIRETLKSLSKWENVRNRSRVYVSHKLWDEVVRAIDEESPDLLILEWPCHFDALHTTLAEVLAYPPCDIAVVRSPISACPKRVLLPIRGGPFAELALRLSLSIAQEASAEVTSLHLLPDDKRLLQDAPFKGLANVLANLPEVDQIEMQTDDPVDTILSQSRQYDLVVMGASARPLDSEVALGRVAHRVLQESPAGVIVVKTMRPMPADLHSPAVGQSAISVLVDKWFAENTYHSNEFTDLDHLVHLKHKQDLTISLAMPALNEEETVANVILTLKSALMEKVQLLDEIVLMDSNSTDTTREIAESLGIPVVIHQQILPQHGVRSGKGEALWKSLIVTRGDIILWIDTDIVNIHPRFVYGLLGPLLTTPRVRFVKGFYRRPIKVGNKVQAGGGGRVTELTARPLINLFYPELSGIIQPLSGEYGGRRSALEQLPFFSGYGVEIGLLIDFFEKFGLSAIAQVDLEERIHHNQPLESLSKMSFAIIQAVIHKLEGRYGRGILEEVNRTMKLIRYEPGRFFLDVEEIAELERPPMIELVEYNERHS